MVLRPTAARPCRRSRGRRWSSSSRRRCVVQTRGARVHSRRRNHSDRGPEFVKCGRYAEHRRGVESRLVVAAAQVPDVGMPADLDVSPFGRSSVRASVAGGHSICRGGTVALRQHIPVEMSVESDLRGRNRPLCRIRPLRMSLGRRPRYPVCAQRNSADDAGSRSSLRRSWAT